MGYNYTLRYRTFDQLLDDVSVDFVMYDLENYIEPAQLIKVAKRVNYDLGLRIMMTKQAVLEVEKGRVKLPDDFFVLNYALMCDQVSITTAVPQGTNIQEIPVYQETPASISSCTDGTVNCLKCQPSPCTCGCAVPVSACSTTEHNPLVPYGDQCTKPRIFVNCKNECFELVQIINTTTHTYSRSYPLRILPNDQNVDCNCPNIGIQCADVAWIKDGFLHTNFTTGKVYINYQGMLEDDDGNLLVPDHDLLNEYYEYALKQRILENLIMNSEPVGQKMELIEARLRAARNNALSIVNMPNFAEMKQVWQMNRKAMYAKYYDMFKSSGYYNSGYRNDFNPGFNRY